MEHNGGWVILAERLGPDPAFPPPEKLLYPWIQSISQAGKLRLQSCKMYAGMDKHF